MRFDHIPGVLGKICQERAADYASAVYTPAAARVRRYRFEQALSQTGLSLIAEVKSASPSKGHIAHLDPVEAAQAYVRGGARAISVLTEPRHFGGSREALQSVVAALGSTPILRKDFVVHPAMLQEAADWGASAALLMVSVLGEHTAEYLRIAHHLGLDALVEVHDENELEIAMRANAPIIGINNRDLTTLEIDLQTTPYLIEIARFEGYNGILVAESGYSQADQVRAIRGLADAVLVGSSLAGSDDLEAAAAELMSV